MFDVRYRPEADEQRSPWRANALSPFAYYWPNSPIRSNGSNHEEIFCYPSMVEMPNELAPWKT